MVALKKHISNQGKNKMFETTKILIKNDKRSLFSKINESPILYFFFGVIMFTSLVLFAFLTFYLQVIETRLDVEFNDVFFMLIFIFLGKSGYDFYNYFVKSDEAVYALSTSIKHEKTISEIFFAVLSTNLFIWFVLSSIFIFFLFLLPVDIFYPFEYLYFNLGAITAVILGPCIAINFFSDKRYQLLPSAILLAFIFLSQNPIFVCLMLPIAVLHLIWSLNHSITSYQNIRRKQRFVQKTQTKIRSIEQAFFYKETTILWRDNLFFSFVFTSASTGFGTGYLYLRGTDLFIPESLREMYSGFLPALFIFVGILVVVIYTAVYPSLTFFLNEDKTMWLIRHIPITNKKIILGKTTTLFLTFIAAIPFVAFVSVFTGLENIGFVIWLLISSFIISAAISIPLGVKYVGKKSDIMLLYSVTMLLFAILSPLVILGRFIYEKINYGAILLALIIVAELAIFYISLTISEKILDLKYKTTAL